MSPESFLRDLHADPSRSKPLDWEVDWEDAPLAYKLYRGLPAISLSPEVPLVLGGRERGPKPDLTGLGHLLWYAYGLTQLSHSCAADPTARPMQMHRRFVPSGGGLYPNELYVYLKTKDAPDGIYHYDAAHHRLVLLREGDYDSFLASALGNRCKVSACFGAIFVSTVFWKNYYKYNHFAYRLQGLDAGVLIGQSLEAAKRFGYAARVYYQFLDRAVNRLLGLSDREESVYAVIPLSAEPADDWFSDGSGESGNISSTELCRQLEEIRHDHYVRSRYIKPYPMLIHMNEASMIEYPGAFRRAGAAPDADSGVRAAYLPRVDRPMYDLAAVCRKRYSPESEFVAGKVTAEQAGALLQDATASCTYRNDLDGPRDNPASRVSLYLCMHQVEGVPDGAYRYDAATHALRRLFPGDHRHRLQQAMYLNNVNLFQVPLCLHAAGNKNFLIPELGYRGYRIQQMETGILVQRLLLAASAAGLGGRPLLGFHADRCDEIYDIAPQGKTSLIQIPIGPYHHRSRLEGGLHA
ncbi:SagB/ThcOx family dehydrogenase [Paenibacillus mesophilus]|uniref:SagB family peptide dehydrogenase n=1 Tax=Paenibacillus mesophilus TaxID=2582849 RepID=UPI00110DCD23|nr:SagB family peptide dehydrogenase [Paenibacillus mesophilus]TMV43993.1 SagB/ThcOx family dehydrogenase [Paenibacillus mesophilus]